MSRISLRSFLLLLVITAVITLATPLTIFANNDRITVNTDHLKTINYRQPLHQPLVIHFSESLYPP
ncbi:MAG TPA: hypothetical protein VLL52_13750, partial [Anaerolineae bacterium]|nr:hypothetical protein [Anaerolineae bacterium]